MRKVHLGSYMNGGVGCSPSYAPATLESTFELDKITCRKCLKSEHFRYLRQMGITDKLIKILARHSRYLPEEAMNEISTIVEEAIQQVETDERKLHD